MKRIDILNQLGLKFKDFIKANPSVVHYACVKNAWFTPDSIALAAKNWGVALAEESLKKWLANYPKIQENQPEKTLGIIAAGNIPWVALHDVICGVLAGYKVKCKLSTNDDVLMKWAIDTIKNIDPSMISSIEICEGRLEHIDAIIATGSDNSARYFEYYFKNTPQIIRKNRSSVAILDPDCTPLEMKALADDIFTYFGLGCRNVSKVFVPMGFDITKLIDQLEHYNHIGNHHKYYNNYTYHKAIALMNLDKHLDNGFMLFREKDELKAPLSQLYYSFYSNRQDLLDELQNSNSIQCIVGKGQGCIPYGQAQNPNLADYADGIDTLKFLLAIN